MLRHMGMGLCVLAAGVFMSQRPASASTAASATISSQQLSPTSWQYSLDLTNTGTTTINTFWNAWIVYQGLYVYDLLPTQPSAVTAPSGWAGGAVNDSIYTPGAFGIEWTSATGLAAGQSLSGFTFTSDQSPSTVEGTSPVFSLYNTDESWVYNGPSQSEAGLEFTPTVVPEPATAILLIPATLLVARRRRRSAK